MWSASIPPCISALWWAALTRIMCRAACLFVYLVLDPAVPAAKRKQIIKELRQLCIEELPEYVQPVGYKIIPEMPLTLAAKFDYRKLEEEITPRDY